MSRHRSSIAAAVRGLEIHTSTEYSWQGRRSPPLPRNVAAALTPESARAFLVASMQETLYAEFYTRGGAFGTRHDVAAPEGVGRTPFVERLSSANAGLGCVDTGWFVSRIEEDAVVLHRDGLDLWVQPDECVTEPERPLRRGAAVGLPLPKEHLVSSPGFYVALSNAPFPETGAETIVRLYWNLRETGAASFIQATTTILNDAGAPFRAKVLEGPRRFDRCDAGVLYLPRSAYFRHHRLIAEIHGRIAPRLRRRNPVFTKRLAPGLALAEDNGSGQSFGMDRCRLIADGTVRAHEHRERSLSGRVQAVVAGFAEAGLDVDRPYLEPGSSDDYDLDLSTTATS